jgi:hypothetical protein
MSFNNSFIAATQIIDRVEEKVHEHYRDKRIAQIAVPDSTLYALEIGHTTTNINTIVRDNRKDD